jgi:TnpA family transposase
VQLLALPTGLRELEERYSFTPSDLEFIGAHRTNSNRLGIAVQLCFLRHPGWAWTPEEAIPGSMLRWIAAQVNADPGDIESYAKRDSTRREHFLELLQEYNWRSFGLHEYREMSAWLMNQAGSTDQGITLITLLISQLRHRRIVVPVLPVLERLTIAARSRARRKAYRALNGDLTFDQRRHLDRLLELRDGSRQTWLGWLRQAIGVANPNNILACIERLTFIRQLHIPIEWARRIHQNRLVQIAREGAGTDVAHLRSFSPERRYATLVAIVLDTATILIDETLEMHERFLGKLFNKAERKHLASFQEQGKAINDKVRLYALVGQALIEAKQNEADPFSEIEKLMTWEAFKTSVAEASKLARPEEFDHLAFLTQSYPQLRRYAPQLLEAFEFRPTSGNEELLQAVALLRELNFKNARRVPDNAPTGFIRPRWQKHVFTTEGIDRRFYETCVLSELGKTLRAGDLWVVGSRRYKDFEEYLLPLEVYRAIKLSSLAVDADCGAYLQQRSEHLDAEFLRVDRLAKADQLPEASVVDGVLKIIPPDEQEPEELEQLTRQAYAMLPRIKITDLLVEVDEWASFTAHFTHLRNGEVVSDRALLLSAILADGINLGISRMADACPGISASLLSRIATWHIREETYSKALAEIVNHHHQIQFAGNWGDGTTSSSDGQRFRTGGRGDARGQVNARYGTDPSVTFYTHVSDQYAPFYTKLINATVRDATHVLDGLLYHESELQIEEHYTDTAGFTDHVFALCHLLGFRFAPRIRHIGQTRLFSVEKPSRYPRLEKLIGGTINTKQITAHWDEVLRLTSSIQQGTVTASLMLRKLGAYPRQNALAMALREIGKLERTSFLLEYIQNIELRKRIHAGLNKGEARNALARAVFFNRLGELRDRTYEIQQHRASGLNLVVAAIALWNTVYLERAVRTLLERGFIIDQRLLAHLSPLKWEHINLTGDYHWRRDGGLRNRKLRPLRSQPPPTGSAP